jgi:hypothetical protein
MKVVLNISSGWFDMSETAICDYCQRVDIQREDFNLDDVKRTDPNLIDLVELYGDNIDTHASELTIVEVPDEFKDAYSITEDSPEDIKLDLSKLVRQTISDKKLSDKEKVQRIKALNRIYSKF